MPGITGRCDSVTTWSGSPVPGRRTSPATWSRCVTCTALRPAQRSRAGDDPAAVMRIQVISAVVRVRVFEGRREVAHSRFQRVEVRPEAEAVRAGQRDLYDARLGEDVGLAAGVERGVAGDAVLAQRGQDRPRRHAGHREREGRSARRQRRTARRPTHLGLREEGTIPRLTVLPSSFFRIRVFVSSSNGLSAARASTAIQSEPSTVSPTSTGRRPASRPPPRRASGSQWADHPRTRRRAARSTRQLGRIGIGALALDEELRASTGSTSRPCSVRNGTSPARTSRPALSVSVSSGPRSLAKRHEPARRGGRPQRHAEQLQELAPVALGDLVAR